MEVLESLSRHVANATDKADHQAKRKLLVHAIAQKTIANLEPIIPGTINTLVQFDKHAFDAKPLIMRCYLNYFTIVVFSHLLHPESLGCLEYGNYFLLNTNLGTSRTHHAPFIRSLHDATYISINLGLEAPLLPLAKRLVSYHPSKRARANYDNIIYYSTTRGLRETRLDSDSGIFFKLLANNKNEPLNLPLRALVANSSAMMNAQHRHDDGRSHQHPLPLT